MSKIGWSLLLVAFGSLLVPVEARAENKKVCVEVVLQRSTPKPAQATPPPAPTGADGSAAHPSPAPAAPAAPESGVVVAGSDADVLPATDRSGARANLPIGQRPLAYLKRLMEHFVSHEKGFTAVASGCEETLRVEMYPLIDGWTAFARYSGTGREERVDRLLPVELSQFAERAATALLHGKPISATINRETVLASDSKEYAQRIGGTHHFQMGVGTQIRMGRFATAGDDQKLTNQLRVFSPVAAMLGYRGVTVHGGARR
jgi:hypothetical protein